MKKIFVIASFLFVFQQLPAQDSLQKKKDSLITKIEKSFSGDWSFRLMNKADMLRWDTILSAPTIRFYFFHQNQNYTDSFASYFFHRTDADTVMKKIAEKYVQEMIISSLKDSVIRTLTLPTISWNANWLVVNFDFRRGLESLRTKLKNDLNLDRVDLTIDNIQISEVEEDEPPPPPPPPPPPKKKTRKIKNN